MLNIFRRGIVSKIMLGVLGLGLFAIVITGFGTGGMGGLGGVGGLGADTLAKVGGRSITAAEITDQVQRQLRRVQEQQPGTDMGAFLRQGAFEEILRQLITQKSVIEFSQDQGLGASKRMIDGEIASIPAFKNLAGQFDANTFRQAIAQEGISEQALREDISGSLLQRQLLLPVGGAIKVPDAMAQRYASLLLEERSGTVGLVPAARMGAGKEPTPAEVQAFWRESQARYTIPERRVLRYAEFGLENVAAAAKPTDADIQGYYNANQALYGPKQTRTLSQVVLPTEAAARSFAQKVRSGTSFAAAAQQAGFGAGDISLGDQRQEDFAKLSSAAVADAAFAAPEGQITAPVRSQFGWHVVRVDKLQTIPARPIAQVRGEIEQQLAAQKTLEAMTAMVTRIEDRIGGGATLEEVAQAEKLTIKETPPLTSAGIQFDNANWKAPEIRPLLKGAFDMSADDDPVVEALVPQQRYALMAVTRIVPAAPPPFAQMAERVKADLARRRASDRAKAVATALAAKISGGVPAAKAFAEAGVALPAPEPVKARRLEIARPGQPVSPPLGLMFSLPKSRAKILQAPNGIGWYVVHLESATPGDAKSAPQLVDATRVQFQRIMGEEYARQFSRAIEQSVGVERNDSAIRRAKQAMTSTAPAQ